MSGDNVPYHLRPNKAVERHLFLELLLHVDRYFSIDACEYIGLGGPFSEDHRLIHGAFPKTSLVSIEDNDVVWERQRFNLPYNGIKRFQKSLGEFIAGFERKKRSIFWLDYANANEYLAQIQEFEFLLTKLDELDVVKITLNANPGTLRGSNNQVGPDDARRPETADEMRIKRIERLTQQLAGYIDPLTTKSHMTREFLPSVLALAVRSAAAKGLRARASQGLYFQPLASFAYADSEHQMLTVTGVVLTEARRDEFLQKTELPEWAHSSLVWGLVREVVVPAMSPREKLFVDQKLPCRSVSALHDELGFRFQSDPDASLALLTAYAAYYRYYPNFQRTLV